MTHSGNRRAAAAAILFAAAAMWVGGCAASHTEPPAQAGADVRHGDVSSARRTASAGAVAAPPSSSAAAKAALERRIPEVKFDDANFADVVDFLRDTTKQNIFVNWRALEAAGIDRATPVGIRLADVPVGEALRFILDDVGGSTVELDYRVMPSGTLVVSTAEDLAKHRERRVIDVSHVLASVAPATPATQPAGGVAVAPASLPGHPTPQVERLMEVIVQSIEPDTWRGNGGSVGTITSFGDKLIITSTTTVLDEVEALLAELATPAAAAEASLTDTGR